MPKTIDKEIDEIVAPVEKSRKRFWLIFGISGGAVLLALLIFFGISYYSVGQSAQLIKGNRISHIYHLSNCPNYDDISDTNIIWFATEQDARNAGFRKAKNCP